MEPNAARALTLADRAYASAVLSQRGAVDIGVLRQLHDTSINGMRGTMGAAMLGAALANAGDRGRSANAFRTAQASMNQSVRGDYYGSPLRNVAGMLPLALGTGPGAEERRTIAIVIIGGQTLSLLLTLVVTPVAYAFLEDVVGFVRRVVRIPARRVQVAPD